MADGLGPGARPGHSRRRGLVFVEILFKEHFIKRIKSQRFSLIKRAKMMNLGGITDFFRNFSLFFRFDKNLGCFLTEKRIDNFTI